MRKPRPTKTRAPRAARWTHFFEQGSAEGGREQRNLLGGKGANLAEMCKLGLPVPPGFTLSTEVCTHYYAHGRKYPEGLEREVEASLARLERATGKRFGDARNPLLVSVRSGARVSMPGMMDTVLNLGLNDTTARGLAERSGSRRFALDAYRRFVQMYGDVVLGIKPTSKAETDPFDAALEHHKRQRGVQLDTQLGEQDLERLVAEFKSIVRARTGRDFPDDPREQLWGAIGAVFNSWMNERAIAYRAMNHYPSSWGTAVNIVAMVFGNLGPSSGTGVAFTRDPSTGEKRFYGEYLMNAQGEDVVAGTRTPLPIAKLASEQPRAFRELGRIQKLLERHYRDMQDIEFTIEDGRLYMLQCRAGKRTGFAAVRIAVDMAREKLITREEALLRVEPETLDQLLQPVFPAAERERALAEQRVLTRGLNAGPGAATGRLVFHADDARDWAMRGESVILARTETSPEDIRGMQASTGILTARGGMTSHAALVARQMGKVCVAGAGELEIDYGACAMRVGEKLLREGDWISLDGSTGEVFEGRLATAPSPVIAAVLRGDEHARRDPVFRAYDELMRWADAQRSMRVRANADQPDQCAIAVAFGAEGVGLCRTEHMFFDAGKIERMREMILAESELEREAALARLLPLQRIDFEGIFRTMEDRPVTIRSLDPPLHEFLPHEPAVVAATADALHVSQARVLAKVESLHEVNPMLGHRGCRLGITHPSITRMQARAIFEAACAVASSSRKKPRPEIMIPLVGHPRELELQARIVRETAEAVFAELGQRIPYLVGTMIELPRACLAAGAIAREAEFFSFGTNDLTQTCLGISRDDSGKFIPSYLEHEIYGADPFASLDEEGVGRLMEIACEGGRAERPEIKIGICGEHGGDPRSIESCQRLGLSYVSCSPYRVPIARLAAAQAAIRARRAAAAGAQPAVRAKAAKSVRPKGASPSASSKRPKPKAEPRLRAVVEPRLRAVAKSSGKPKSQAAPKSQSAPPRVAARRARRR